ncbi:hypothetical protein AB0B31_35350 [Catellatospora citrea]|uniref:hypothetical protein n=1 Tax=Catellatospora citrea TaxID=53366 RepID=UPI0033D530CC
MASADVRELPVYALLELSRWRRRTRHAVLTPAVRWRVVIEQLTPIDRDVLLETVIQLREAGEKSDERISDLLQIPVDLVQHLQARIVTDQLRSSPSGQVRTGQSSVTWVYRDLATGELWPEPATEAPPANIQYRGKFGGVHLAGTAGRPVEVRCLVLDHEGGATPADPTSLELARFSSASRDPNRRTALVSGAERCLVMSPLARTRSGVAVLTSLGTPHVGLSHALSRYSAQSQGAMRWLEHVPPAEQAVPQQRTPLGSAVADLRDALAEWQVDHSDEEHLISRIDLALRRACDQRWYVAHRDSFEISAAEVAREQLIKKLGLPTEQADALMHAELGSVAEAVLKLVGDPVFIATDTAWLRALADATARLLAVVRRRGHVPLPELAQHVIDVCTQLQNSPEVVDVGQK